MKGRAMRRQSFGVFALLALLLICAGEAAAGKRIAVITYSREGFYLKSEKGLLDKLNEAGFGSQTATLTVENAGGDKVLASELVQKQLVRPPDLLVTLGTSVTIFALKLVKSLPIVFSTVYDPVEAGIARSWSSSGNNCTGASTRIPPTRVLALVAEAMPIKSIGVLYTPGEKNSESQLRGLQEAQASSGIRILPVIIGREDEVEEILPDVVSVVDAVYLTGSTIVGGSVPAIVRIANKAGVLTATHLDDLVEKGAVLGICTDSYLVGRLAGEKAVQVLQGADPASIPIESGKTVDIILNRTSVSEGKFPISGAFLAKVTKFVP